jgi:hypothetical protein
MFCMSPKAVGSETSFKRMRSSQPTTIKTTTKRPLTHTWTPRGATTTSTNWAATTKGIQTTRLHPRRRMDLGR